MGTVLRILVGLGITTVGAFIVIRTRTFADFFGMIEWAEAKLGGGGTYLLYKVIGIIAAFIGIVVTTNLWDWFLEVTLGSLFPRF